MAGQAGWYRAPGEEGLLRYWNGSLWTEHRQPDPAAVAAPVDPPAAPVSEPTVEPDLDPMAEYERQFAKPSLPDSDFDHPTYDFGAGAFTSASAAPVAPSTDVVVSAPQPLQQSLPQYRPQAALAPAPIVSVPTPEFAGQAAAAPTSLAPSPLGPIALGPAAVAPAPAEASAPTSEFERVFSEFQALAESSKGHGIAEELGGAALAADGVIGFGPNRKGVLGALKSMGAAIVIILVGIGAMLFFSAQDTVGTGEVKTTAIVTSLGDTSDNSCTPIARFAVAGKSYTANSSVGISPCPLGLGQSVDVIYSAADPASAARIEVGSSVTQFLWLVPILGGLVFVGSLITFIVRAGSIVGGIALIRDGRKRSKKPAVTA